VNKDVYIINFLDTHGALKGDATQNFYKWYRGRPTLTIVMHTPSGMGSVWRFLRLYCKSYHAI